jgi:DNA-binding NarL/FixJ family response regulator
VAAGRSNTDISAALHQSTSTTKRDIADLLAIFDAANRAGLTQTAARLGFLTA